MLRVQGKTLVGHDRTYKPGYVIIDTKSGLIVEIGDGNGDNSNLKFDKTLRRSFVLPGFVDIHNHGLGGTKDVLDYWTNPEYTLSRLAKVGVTGCLATLTFPSEPLLSRSLKACREVTRVIGKSKSGAVVYGIHAEGPIIATYGGLPNSDTISKWSISKFQKLLDDIGPYLSTS